MIAVIASQRTEVLRIAGPMADPDGLRGMLHGSAPRPAKRPRDGCAALEQPAPCRAEVEEQPAAVLENRGMTS